MSFYRNRYFFGGILLILMGLQFRRVESFVLNESTTRFVAKMTSTPLADNSTAMGAFFAPVIPKPQKKVTPPRWMALSMIAVGCVISFHALSIPKYARDGGHS